MKLPLKQYKSKVRSYFTTGEWNSLRRSFLFILSFCSSLYIRVAQIQRRDGWRRDFFNGSRLHQVGERREVALTGSLHRSEVIQVNLTGLESGGEIRWLYREGDRRTLESRRKPSHTGTRSVDPLVMRRFIGRLKSIVERTGMLRGESTRGTLFIWR